jgi:hypothetical protein
MIAPILFAMLMQSAPQAETLCLSTNPPTCWTVQPTATGVKLAGVPLVPPGTAAQPAKQLPQSAVFAFAGYGTKVNAAVGYAQLISQSAQTYSYTAFRYVPIHGKITLPVPTVMTGVATRLRGFGWLDVYGMALAGGGTAGTATVGSFALGGIGIITPQKSKHWSIALGADQQKTAGGRAYTNLDLGLVWRTQ